MNPDDSQKTSFQPDHNNCSFSAGTGAGCYSNLFAQHRPGYRRERGVFYALSTWGLWRLGFDICLLTSGFLTGFQILAKTITYLKDFAMIAFPRRRMYLRDIRKSQVVRRLSAYRIFAHMQDSAPVFCLRILFREFTVTGESRQEVVVFYDAVRFPFAEQSRCFPKGLFRFLYSYRKPRKLRLQ